jgi:hypothetical protein
MPPEIQQMNTESETRVTRKGRPEPTFEMKQENRKWKKKTQKPLVVI